MPELPDLEYLVDVLDGALSGATVASFTLHDPVLLRQTFECVPEEIFGGRTCTGVERHGPFVVWHFDGDLRFICHLMLAGEFRLEPRAPSRPGKLGFAMTWDDGHWLGYKDPKRMSKLYLVRGGDTSMIPRFDEQAPDVLSDGFTLDYLQRLVESTRCQIRVLLMDQTRISAIGNAYADEILFDAGIHPKARCQDLTPDDVRRLCASIAGTLQNAMTVIAERQPPIHQKQRDFLRVRNRKGEPCPQCGATIRREGVRGMDTFFCPRCQPPTRKGFIDWSRTNADPPPV